MKGMRSAEGPPNSQSPSSPTPMMQFMKPITGLVVAQVFAKYHGLAPGGTIVKDNLAPMYTLVSATILYWLIDGAIVQSPIFFTSSERLDQILRRCAFACAVLAALSLLSMFFLKYPFSIVPLIIWAFLSLVLVAWPVRGKLYNLLRGGVLITKICDTVANWWRGVNVINEEAFSSAV